MKIYGWVALGLFVVGVTVLTVISLIYGNDDTPGDHDLLVFTCMVMGMIIGAVAGIAMALALIEAKDEKEIRQMRRGRNAD